MTQLINFFDTESTGLGLNDKAISVGCLVARQVDNTMGVALSAELFNLVDVPICAEAERVHNISSSILVDKSKGKRPKDHFETIFDLFNLSNVLVAWNTPFDHRMLNKTYGIDIYEMKDKDSIRDLMVDLKPVFGKRVKQTKALEQYLEYTNNTKEQLDIDFLRDIKSKDTVVGSHNALYDAYCLARLYAMAYEIEWTHDS